VCICRALAAMGEQEHDAEGCLREACWSLKKWGKLSLGWINAGRTKIPCANVSRGRLMPFAAATKMHTFITLSSKLTQALP